MVDQVEIIINNKKAEGNEIVHEIIMCTNQNKKI